MLARDFRDSVRSVSRAPGFALVVTLTLGLGIGAVVTMFSVMEAVLWRPLPYPDADRLILLDATTSARENRGLTALEQLELQKESKTLDAVARISGVDANLDIDGELERVYAVSANEDALRMLGAQPALGRLTSDRQDIGSEGAVTGVVISDGLWRRRFGADRNVVGRVIQVNNLRVQVIGVLRPGLKVFLPAEWGAAEDAELWFPRGDSTDTITRSSVLARLAPGVPLGRAQAELDTLSAAFVAARPLTPPAYHIIASPIHDRLTASVEPALGALAVAVAFVLLISCVNVANLMLARAKTREREIAVREALGAEPHRLIAQLLTESAILAVVAGGIGLAIAVTGVELVEWLEAIHLPRRSQIGIDGSVTVFAAGVAMAVCLAVGVLPALRMARRRDPGVLRSARSGMATPGIRRMQRALVVAEVALSIVPLVGGGLMLRSYWNLAHTPIGFDPEGVVTAHAQVSFRVFPTPERRWTFVQDSIDAVGRLPGIERVSASSALPYVSANPRRFVPEGDRSGGITATFQSVAPGYLAVTRVRLLEGRDVTPDDIRNNRAVAIIDERMASRFWPEGAMGKRLEMEVGPRRTLVEIIGVAAPVRATAFRSDDLPHVFLPYNLYATDPWIAIRTTESAAALAPRIRRAVESLGGGRPVVDIRPLKDYVDESYGDTRFTMMLLTVFAAVALLLAGVGIYATMAYLTLQRMREFGVRAALGANARSLVSLVAGEVARLTALGGIVGLIGALNLAGALRGLLYGVAPVDATTIAIVSGLVFSAAIVAASVPAFRASKADPISALRAE